MEKRNISINQKDMKGVALAGGSEENVIIEDTLYVIGSQLGTHSL